MEKIVWQKLAGNLDFVKQSNFFWGSTELAVPRCIALSSEENTHGGVLLCIVNLQGWSMCLYSGSTLLQMFSCVTSFFYYTSGACYMRLTDSLFSHLQS